MKNWNEYTLAERKAEAEERLPELNKLDNPKLSLHSVFIERATFGVQRLTDRQINKINEIGYDAFLINKMNQLNKIGLTRYHQLCCINKNELTSEHIDFHSFRKKNLNLKNG